MNIVVFSVPSESGGSLTILKQYYENALIDTTNDWYFVVSMPKLDETNNVTVLRFPWIKKNWLFRLIFDVFFAPKLVKKLKADSVISLQNIVIWRTKVKQTLYLHQPLPFVDKKYKINENYKFWIYQNIISRLIYKSLIRADSIIVQTTWMKDACIQKLNIPAEKIDVVPPKVNILETKKYKETGNRKIFFYPASCHSYKNHEIIISAAEMLAREGLIDFNIVFTISGKENKYSKGLFNKAKSENLPIFFLGKISKEEVYEWYCKSTLIFPSFIETYGLPLLEARMHTAPILASDCSFSHEILDDYNNVEFFNPFSLKELYQLMKRSLESKNNYN